MNKKLFMALNLLSALAFADCSSDCSDSSSSCNSSESCDKSCTQSVNLWQPHAFSAYASRDIIQKRTFYDVVSHRTEGFVGMFSTAFEYMQNFGGKCDCNNLGARPFWSGTNTMTYGSNNGESNIDAYQFGMGDVDGQGTITLTPKIKHIGGEFMLHFTKRKDERGVFFTLKAPIAAMSINTCLTETVAAPTGDIVVNETDQWLTYPGPYGRYATLTEAWQAGSYEGGEVNSSRHKLLVLTKGRMADCKQTVIRAADITAVLGYKVYASEKGFVDVGFKFSSPTGNVPNGEFVLEPIVGRAVHWGVGGEVTAKYQIYRDEDCDRGVDFWFEGEAVHLFSGRRPDWRSFDLKQNGLGSKYLLIQHYFATNPVAGTAQTSNPYGFTPSFVTNAVNVTTMPVKSSFAVEGNFALAFDMYKNNWNLLLGGEFWGRSREKLCIDSCNVVRERVANLNDYAVLGRQISEYTENGTGATTNLYLCEPLAQIGKSQDAYLPSSSFNPNTDSLPEGIADARNPENRIPSKLTDALDINGAEAGRAFTGKVFGSFGYTFKEHHYTSNLAILGGAEFKGKGNNAINLWSVGLQGSINF